MANHIPINARIIGANEHESHYVFDLLFNNTTGIEPEVHSTDTHGTNQVNFALLHLFGYQFAPRYKDIYDTVTKSLYGFRHPSRYENLPLMPIRKINTRLIISEWENITRIILSLAFKATRSTSSRANSVPTPGKTKPSALYGNTTTSSEACIYSIMLIRRHCVAMSIRHSIAEKIIINSAEQSLTPIGESCVLSRNTNKTSGTSAAVC